jgi:large subunit ribosomal protein L6
VSRIGRKPVSLPTGVSAAVSGRTLTIRGPLGELHRTFHPDMQLAVGPGQVTVSRPSDESRHRALHGLSRTLVSNMVEGVTRGFERSLEIQGVGYRAETKPFGLTLVVGLSHPVDFRAPAGVKLTAEQPTLVKVSGCDKELVGLVAANIRAVRPPEPYKGKGIRYVGERVRRKAGKTGAKQ